jgi:diguanylate cyclase (GGDEF)-like protein
VVLAGSLRANFVPSAEARRVRLALRLIAVGIVVLASLLYAAAVQVATRNEDIASYVVGENAVRLVERLRQVSAGVGAGRSADVRTALAHVLEQGHDPVLHEGLPYAEIVQQAGAWNALGARRPDPALVRLTNETMRESYLRVGTIAVTRGSATTADGILAEASLLALPVANAQFERLAGLISLVEPGRPYGAFSRTALGALYAEARTASHVALASAWIDRLPPAVRTQAIATRAADATFLDLLRTRTTRGDAFRYRSELIGPARIASQRMSTLQEALLPVLEARLIDARHRSEREIALIVGLVTAVICIVTLLSLQVLRSQVRSRRARAAFQHQAMHDALTGLPNRRAFTQAAANAVAAWTPVNDRTSWILSIDMDYFKEVNDRYGHQAGDAFLVAASQRLHGATPLGDLVARVGGDEFAVLVHHYDPDSAHALTVGENICKAFADPIAVGGVEHRLAASVGIVAVDALHETVDSLLRDADIAMYRAKEDGGDRVVVFDDVLRQEIVDRAELAADLRAALERNIGPRVVFQPILSLQDRTCYGFEALVRWRHPVRGEVDAATLIDVAQEARLMVPLGRRVVNEVCRHLAAWRDDGLVLERLAIHVNISPMEASHPETYESILEAITRYAIPPQTIIIELTETSSMDSVEAAGRFLAKLHEMGVRVCLDDFGTGYSSLQHLNDFQIDEIKVDRSFVVSAAADPAKIPIVAGIIALARGLNAEVIAEGIETIEQRELITDLGCNLVQGYLFGRPMPPEEALRFARQTLAVAPSTTLPA